MCLHVTAAVETPLLSTALERGTTAGISVRQQKMASDGTVDMIVQTEDDPDGFEAGLDADDTVARWVQLGDVDSGRVYQIYLSEEGCELSTHSSWVDEEALFVSARASADGWRETIRFADRSGLEQYVDFCERSELPCSLVRVWDGDDSRNGPEYGLTELQGQTLLTALQQGYYTVPRRISLQELAVSFDISHQALSERLRRGVGTLIENTIATRQY